MEQERVKSCGIVDFENNIRCIKQQWFQIILHFPSMIQFDALFFFKWVGSTTRYDQTYMFLGCFGFFGGTLAIVYPLDDSNVRSLALAPSLQRHLGFLHGH